MKSLSVLFRFSALFGLFNLTNGFTVPDLRSNLAAMVSTSTNVELVHALFGRLSEVNPKAIEKCFDPDYNGLKINLFEENMSLEKVVWLYYSNSSTLPSEGNIVKLVESIEFIVIHVLGCLEENGESQYKVGFTRHSDEYEINGASLKLSEGGRRRVIYERPGRNCGIPGSFQAPAKKDWREGYVTPVRDQGNCGSCWAFATTSAVESAYLINKNSRLVLSTQELVDFVPNCGCDGCTMEGPFEYVHENGLTDEETYPYKQRKTTNSDPKEIQPKSAFIQDFCIRSNLSPISFLFPSVTDELITKLIAYYGPVTVAVHSMNPAFMNYKGGVLNSVFCSIHVDHMITVVGYDEQSFICKNSWGEGWGEDGYVRIARHRNMCGIESQVAVPLL